MKLASQKICTACMACIDVCAHNALTAQIDKNGYYSIITNKSLCTNCNICSNICPVINFKPIETGESRPYAAWSSNLKQRSKSASGGIFAAIATIVLHKGGVVYGAAIDGFDIIHKRITDIEQLYLLQGSKYQQSNLTGIYRQVRKDLSDNKTVLFSGLGCQIAGLYSFLGKINRDRLYTIDMICGGLSTMLPMLQLKDSGKYKAIKSFRDKENGWQSIGFRYSLKMVRRDDSIENLGLENIVLNTFSSKLLKRSSCLNCKYTGFHRISDMTIGDFWGTDKFKEEHNNGLSIIAIHSNRIVNLLQTANIELQAINWVDFTSSNPNYYWTKQPLIQYFLGRNLALLSLKNNKNKAASYFMNSYSYTGLALRIYLKFNNLQKILFFNNRCPKL